MKSVLLTVLMATMLVGCGDPDARTMDYPIVPDGLKDCQFFWISNGRSSMQVARCPNSATSTTYTSGKSQATAVVIDGVEYVKK